MATQNDLLQQPLALDTGDILLNAHDTGQRPKI